MLASLEKPKILFIKSDEPNLIEDYFASCSAFIDCMCAYLGQDAHNVLNEQDFDAIFADLTGPFLDAVEISRQAIALSTASVGTVTVLIIPQEYMDYIVKLKSVNVTEVLQAPLADNDLRMVLINHFPSLEPGIENTCDNVFNALNVER